MIIFVKSAPKLGHILFDPLDYEANLTREVTSETENSTSSQYLRSNLTIQYLTTKASNNSNGYGFDETICKEKNDRILCGYNKNKDNLGIEEMLEETENGCRIRGDRLECGYLVGPFTNPRRPPANYEENEDTNNTQSELYHNTTQATVSIDIHHDHCVRNLAKMKTILFFTLLMCIYLSFTLAIPHPGNAEDLQASESNWGGGWGRGYGGGYGGGTEVAGEADGIRVEVGVTEVVGATVEDAVTVELHLRTPKPRPLHTPAVQWRRECGTRRPQKATGIPTKT
ncbi:hypothetical protein RR48_13285 [Papilio machaon]|uniref:Uncharacterized protein n=1 Tax=Papilio machaon TaxID=76193 RepID=A0A194R1C9_PAPMA|nr:hypothetical protein RR48_13285 [Papilio machaon]